MSSYLTKREGFWHFKRQVPKGLAALDKRGTVRQSTKIRVTDDPRGIKALKAVGKMNETLEAYWRGLVEGRGAEALKIYEQTRSLNRIFGVDYVPIAELSKRPIAERLERVEALVRAEKVDDEPARVALLGGGLPKLRLSEVFPTYENLTRTQRTDLSEDQLRKWRNPKIRAIRNLIQALKEVSAGSEDKHITDLTRNDALDFADWWQERVLAEGLDPDTANKDIGHIIRMITFIDKKYRLGLSPVFAGTRLEKNGENKSRPSFSVAWVQNKILDVEALDGLNEEARRVVYVMAETGMRPSEIVNLTRTTIVLTANIPHVQAEPDGRRMKTPQSRRAIPLVGVALAALRAQPDGFPLYRDRGAALSATINKFFDENKLKETGEHTLYSLRHAFKDRLIRAKADELLIDELMGHKNQRPKYGAGYDLDLKLEVLQRIALTPPSIV